MLAFSEADGAGRGITCYLLALSPS